MNFYLWLIICSRGESLRFRGRNCSIAFNKLGCNAAHGLDTERKRSNVEKKYILHVTLKYATLNSSTDSYDLIWVNTLHGFFTEEFLYFFNHSWHTSHTTNHHDLIDITGGKLSILKGLVNWVSKTINQWRDQFFHLRASQSVFKVFWTICIGRKEWKVNFGFLSGRKFLLSFFSLILNTLHGGSVFFDIDTRFFFKFITEEVNDKVVKVFTTKMSITVSRKHFEDTVT